MQYNILHLIPLFEIGGLQRQIANWVAYDPTSNRHFLGILNHSTEGFALIKKEVTVLFNGNGQSRDNLTKSLVETFEAEKGSKIAFEVDSIRFLTPDSGRIAETRRTDAFGPIAA